VINRKKRLHFAFATLAFVLGMFAKSSAVVVLIIAWILDYGIMNRTMRQSILSLRIWIVLVLPTIIFTKLLQPDRLINYVTPLLKRPLIMGDALTFYLYKLFIPISLGGNYGRSPVFVLQHKWIYFMWLIPFSLAVFLWLLRKRKPWLIASYGIFIAGILPVSGLIPFYFQEFSTVADRYFYLSMLGPALALSFFLAHNYKINKKIILIVTISILSFLGIRSSFQTRCWSNSFSLFTHFLKINPNSWFVHDALGCILGMQGKLNKSIEHFYKALELQPNYVKALINLGTALYMKGKKDEAFFFFSKVLQFKSTPKSKHLYISLHYNLGTYYKERGNIDKAIEHYFKALEFYPDFAIVHYNLGIIFEKQDKIHKAITHYSKVLKINPYHKNTKKRLQKILNKKENFKTK